MGRVKIVFLDIDGVLNHSEWLYEIQARWKQMRIADPDFSEMIDERAVKLVDEICRTADARVVISSSWRICHRPGQLNAWLRAKGLSQNILGVRGNEIQLWLDEHDDKDVKSIVILDDDSDMAHLMPRLVQTHFSAGLLPDHVPLALAVLDRPMKRKRGKRR